MEKITNQPKIEIFPVDGSHIFVEQLCSYFA